MGTVTAGLRCSKGPAVWERVLSVKNCPAPNVSDVASPWPPSSFNQHTHALRPMGMNAQEILLFYLGANVKIYVSLGM